MPTNFEEAVRGEDFPKIILKAVLHADFRIRTRLRCGQTISEGTHGELIVNGDTAQDFVQKALERLGDHRRTYDPSKTLLRNLNSATDSIIDAAFKSLKRSPQKDFPQKIVEDEQFPDPADSANDPNSERHAIVQKEIKEDQKRKLQDFREYIKDDKMLLDLLDAFENDINKSNDIATLLDCTPDTVYELKRKLKNKVRQFFNVQKLKELERNINEGT